MRFQELERSEKASVFRDIETKPTVQVSLLGLKIVGGLLGELPSVNDQQCLAPKFKREFCLIPSDWEVVSRCFSHLNQHAKQLKSVPAVNP